MHLETCALRLVVDLLRALPAPARTLENCLAFFVHRHNRGCVGVVEGVVVGGVVVALIAAAFPIEKYFWKGNFAEILLVIYH